MSCKHGNDEWCVFCQAEAIDARIAASYETIADLKVMIERKRCAELVEMALRQVHPEWCDAILEKIRNP